MSTQAAAQQASTQYLSFFIGEEEYGLGILEAREIIQYPIVTKVPSMSACIRGVINLRGSVVPVVDLAVFFGLGERPVSKATCVVVVESPERHGNDASLVGIVVDAVSQVIELRPDEIEPPPAFGTRVRRQFLRGMGKTSKAFVLLLDLGRVLGDVELDRLPSALGGADDPAEAEADATAAGDDVPAEGAEG